MSQNNHSGNLPPSEKITKNINKKSDSKKKAIVNYLTCATLDGLSAKIIEVEATFTRGLPGFAVVGLASSDIQEAKERVKSALLTNEFIFPPLKITVNLSPSDLKKSGTHFDLSIALLIAIQKESIEEEGLFVFGELGLDGRVKSSSTLFPIILSLKEQGFLKRAIVPKEAMKHLSHIGGVEFIAVETLSEAIGLLKSKNFKASATEFSYNAEQVVVGEDVYYDTIEIESDFLDVKGQVNRAFIAQKKRGQVNLNGKLREDEVEQFCILSEDAEKILFSAIERFALSHRSIGSIKKVARTIADLEPSETIEKKHLLEALSYRRR